MTINEYKNTGGTKTFHAQGNKIKAEFRESEKNLDTRVFMVLLI